MQIKGRGVYGRHHTLWRGPARRKWTPRGLFFWTTTCGGTKDMSFYKWPLKQTTLTHGNIKSNIILPFQVLYHLHWQNTAWWIGEQKIQFSILRKQARLEVIGKREKSQIEIKSSLDSWVCRMILQRIRKSLPGNSNRETISLMLVTQPWKRGHFKLKLNRMSCEWTCGWSTNTSYPFQKHVTRKLTNVTYEQSQTQGGMRSTRQPQFQ